MSFAAIVALVLLALGLVFPLLALRLRPKHSAPTRSDDEIVEVKASLLFLNTALPTLLLLLGALGFASYDDIVKKVSAAVKEDYRATIDKKVIDDLTAEIKVMRDQSRTDSIRIETLLAKATGQSRLLDSLSAAAQARGTEISAFFMQALPRGTIIPYLGRGYGFDKTIWALCDGSNGTPDLRERFILGSTFDNIGSKGGEAQHDHSISLDLDGAVTKRNVVEDSRFGGPAAGGVPFKLEKHEHLFKMTKEKGIVGAKSNLPPFVRLVYLMKIQ